jgi:hypothetical protein
MDSENMVYFDYLDIFSEFSLCKAADYNFQ